MVSIKRLLDILATAVALLGTVAVMPFLDMPVLALFLLALGGGAWCDRQGRYPLSGLMSTLLAVIGLLVYAVQITKVDVATPVVHALVLLLTVRLVSAKQGRDYLQIFVLAIFILAGSSLLSLELSFILYLVLLVFCVTLGLVLLTAFTTDTQVAMPRRDLFKLTRVSLIMPVVSLVLMLVFFLILPRTRHPLWNFLNPTQNAVVGLSETVSPGAYAQISAVKKLAFRAESDELSGEHLYWRALVLNQPRGTQWFRAAPPAERSARIEGASPVRMTIYPEPRTDRYLVTLDRPSMVSGLRYRQESDQVFKARAVIDHRIRFEIAAQPGAVLQVAEESRDFYLTVPEVISERVRATAAQWVLDYPDRASRLVALERFFLERGLVYALEDLPGGPDPVDDFLFEKRRGYCEFFATAYTVLARLAGIPTRMVGGYYGGDYNDLGGYYTVFEDTAHVWAEVLDEDNRWVRVDPSQWAENAASSLRDRQSGISRWQQMTDAMNYFWIQAVVVFDFYQQLDFLRNTRNRLRTLQPRSLVMDGWPWVAGTGLVVVGTVFLLRRHRKPLAQRLLEEFRGRVRRRYGQETASEALGLTELAEKLENEACRDFARIYQGAVFRDRALRSDEVVRLKALLRRI
jgi:transglutaminase-like putative cysteine protease